MVPLAKVLPFCGYRYNLDKVPDMYSVTAPPYDIISPEEQKQLYERSEANIVRVDFGVDMEGDNETQNRYQRSGDTLEKWIQDQIMVPESEPAFYIYEQIFSLGTEKPSHSLKGLIARVQLEEFSKKIVLPHEETISKAKADRLRLMETTKANMSSIYSLYLDEDKAIAALIEAQSDREPDISFVSGENITQNLWVIKDKEINQKISALFEAKQLFIADGHHRYETALNYRNQRHAQEGTPIGTAEYDAIMMTLVSIDDSGLFVFPTHRMIRGLENFDEVLLVGLLTDHFSVSKIYFTEGDYAAIITEKLSNSMDATQFALYTGANYYYLLELKNVSCMDSLIEGKSAVYKHLDVTVLHTLILEKFMGIDAENMKEQKNLAYTRDAKEAIEEVKNGHFDCSFIINSTKVSEIREIALANEKMPQKSTYFWPKLLTGLVINRFE